MKYAKSNGFWNSKRYHISANIPKYHKLKKTGAIKIFYINVHNVESGMKYDYIYKPEDKDYKIAHKNI